METQSSSLVRSSELIGVEGELVGIDENALGQVVAKNRRNVAVGRLMVNLKKTGK